MKVSNIKKSTIFAVFLAVTACSDHSSAKAETEMSIGGVNINDMKAAQVVMSQKILQLTQESLEANVRVVRLQAKLEEYEKMECKAKKEEEKKDKK